MSHITLPFCCCCCIGFWLRRLNSHDIPRVTQFTEFICSHHRRRHRHHHRRHSRPINGERGVPAEAEAVQVDQGGAGRGVAVRLTEWKLPKMWNQQQRMQNNKRRATQHGDSAANLNMKNISYFLCHPNMWKNSVSQKDAAAAAAADRTECCRYRCRCRVDSITSAKASGEPHCYPYTPLRPALPLPTHNMFPASWPALRPPPPHRNESLSLVHTSCHMQRSAAYT